MAPNRGPLAPVAKGLLGLGVGVGALMYFHGVFRERLSFGMKNVPKPGEPRFVAALEGLSGSTGSRGKLTGFWREAEAVYSARLEAIAKAKTSVHFETFFMTPGHRADQFADAFIERAKAGVQVLLIVDSNGTKALPNEYWERMRDAGVNVQRFRRFSPAAPLDYLARTHRKLLLIDGRYAYIGGAGISDWWDGYEEIGDEGPWRDLEVRLEGPVVSILEGMFLQNWACTGNDLDLNETLFPDTSVTLERIDAKDTAVAESVTEAKANGHDKAAGGVLTRPAPPDPYHPYVITSGTFSLENSAPRMMYLLSMTAARRRVWIASPYFMPDDNTLDRMKLLCEQGIDVRILTMGPHNDRAYVYAAARALYPDLMAVGARVFEYSPAMMHAKLILVDDAWVSTGSANFDHLSFYNNDELNVSTSDPALIRNVDDFFQESFARSREVRPEDFQGLGRLKQLYGRGWLAFRRVF